MTDTANPLDSFTLFHERVDRDLGGFADLLESSPMDEQNPTLLGLFVGHFRRAVAATRNDPERALVPWQYARATVTALLLRQGRADAALALAEGLLTYPDVPAEISEILTADVYRLKFQKKLNVLRGLVENRDFKGAQTLARDMLSQEKDQENIETLTRLDADLSVGRDGLRRQRLIRIGGVGAILLALLISALVGMGSPRKGGAMPPVANNSLQAEQTRWCQQRFVVLDTAARRIGAADPLLLGRYKDSVQDFSARCDKIQNTPGFVESARNNIPAAQAAADADALVQSWGSPRP